MTRDDALVALRNAGYRISQSALSKWERGGAQPSSGALPYLANTYGVTLDFLYGGDVDEHEQKLAAAHRQLDQALQALASLHARKAALIA